MSGCRSPPTSSWEPKWLGSTMSVITQDQLFWGSARPASDCGNLPQVPAMADNPNTAQLCLLYPSLSPLTTEQLGPKKRLLKPPHVWAENMPWKGTYSRSGPNWNTRSSVSKGKRGKLPLQLQRSGLNPTISQRLWNMGAVVGFESKYKLNQGKIWDWAGPTQSTRGPETFEKILEYFLSRQTD